MEKEIYLYPYSAAEARTSNELALWRASYQANEECARDIEEHIRTHFDGAHLDDSMLQPLLDKWGYKRINFVLANTLQELSYDGRFSRKNQEWAKATFIPQDGTHNISLMVKSHPAVLDGFVNMVREAYKNLGLFGPQHCEPNSFENLDYEGRVLVLSPDTLKESCWSPENQLWLAHDGFGCSPHAIGRSIRSTCLGDGEQTRWNRTDFIGVLREEFLPDWAKEKLAELQAEQPDMGVMKMT